MAAAWEAAPLADAAPAKQPAWMAAPVENAPAVSAQAAGDKPGMLASLGAGLGAGVGKAALGAQYWLGRGVRAVGDAVSPPETTLKTMVTGQQKRGMISSAGDWLVNDAEIGRAKLDAENAPYAEANPTTNAVAKLSGEVVSTLPVGGALATPLKLAAKAGLAPKMLAPVADAVATAGMRAGGATGAAGMAARVAGGAATGGAGASLIDPDSGATGAAIGAAMPGILKAGGAAFKAGGRVAGSVGSEIKAAFQSDTTKAAQELMRALDVTPDQMPALVASLRGAETLVPGSAPTVGQALTSPQSAILERVVSAGPGGEKLRQAIQKQAEARMRALEGVSPVAPDGATQMRADTGAAIANYAQTERGLAANANRAQYQAIDKTGAPVFTMPAESMAAEAQRFAGAGAVGENTMPHQFAREAAALSKAQGGAPPSAILGADGLPIARGAAATPRASTWDEVMRLRSSLNEQIGKAKDAGDRQAAAALTAQKQVVDTEIAKQLPPDMLARWQEANASRAAMGQRFDAGPQAAIFQTRNGAPAREGGEVASLFWGNRPGLQEDVRSFRKLVDDNPALLGQFRSMITTDGAAKAAAGGELGQNFVRWTQSMAPGLREALSPEQFQALQNIAKDVERASAAAARGQTIGKNSATYQNAANALDAGLLGSPFVKAAASRLPVVRNVAEPMRVALADSASKAKAMRLSDLLADANAAADALASQQQVSGLGAGRALQLGGAGLSTPLPLFNLSLRDLALQGAYRGSPLFGGSSNPP